MKITVRVDLQDLREAIGAWLVDHGVPTTEILDFALRAKVADTYTMQPVKELEVTVEYETDSLTRHEARPKSGLEKPP